MKLLTPISERRKIILIFLLAFLLRLLLIKFIPYPFYPVKVDDAHAYDVMASNIIKGNGFSGEENPPYKPVIVRTPVYPLFLAGIYAVFGQAYNIVRVIQALLDSITCFLVYLISLLCFKDKKNCKQLALLAFILTALCPFTAFFVSTLYSEILSAFLFTLSIFLFLSAIFKNRWQYCFLSGIIIGLAFLCRPALYIYPFILVIIMFLLNIRNVPKVFLKYIFVYLAAVFLIWSPWVYRNYAVFARFIPLSLGSGHYLWLATYPPARHAKDFAVDSDKYNAYRKLNGKDALDMDLRLGKEAIARIKKEPFQYLYYCSRRVLNLWVSSYSMYIGIEGSFNELIARMIASVSNIRLLLSAAVLILLKVFLTAVNLILVFAGVLGMVIMARFFKIIYPIILVPIYVTLVQAPLGHANPRYVIPAWPIFLIFSAYGLWYIAGKIISLLVKFGK